MSLLQEYNQFQVKQLTKLIEVTRTDLKKEDRQKVMNMITIDAHSRDMVESIAESGIDRCALVFCTYSIWRADMLLETARPMLDLIAFKRGVLGNPDRQPLRFLCNHGMHQQGNIKCFAPPA